MAWCPPQTDEELAAAWRAAWGDHTPEGTPYYATVRDARGRKAKICFLGSALDDGTPIQPPTAIMFRQWKAAAPNLCISADGGSMHPRQCDSIDRMAHLPQFHDWVAERLFKGKPADSTSADFTDDIEAGGASATSAGTGGRRNRIAPSPPSPGAGDAVPEWGAPEAAA